MEVLSGVKRPGPELRRSFPFSVEIMNDCSYTCTSYLPSSPVQGNLYLLFISRMLTLGSVLVKNAQVRNGQRLNTGRNGKVGEPLEVPSFILR